ncbi:MAG: hypothetical protein R3E66_03555 [bacterium]
MDWTIFAGVVGGVFLLWVLLENKTSRPDGTPVKHHPYRKIMWYIMPRRDDGVVYFEHDVVADKLLDYVEQANKRFDCSVSTVLLAATARALIQTPAMDRFVVGNRMYQRKQPSISFAMKRKRKDKSSKLATVKQPIGQDDTIESIANAVLARVSVERTDAKTYADKEYALFNMLPRPFFKVAHRLFRTLDYYNLLPGSFIENDPLYTSVFLAFLGSVNLDSAYHHLFEHGTCPLFITYGKVMDRVVVIDGQAVVKPTIRFKVTYDERVDDGMTAGDGMYKMIATIEDPFLHLGCLAEDGSDAYKFGEDRPKTWQTCG